MNILEQFEKVRRFRGLAVSDITDNASNVGVGAFRVTLSDEEDDVGAPELCPDSIQPEFEEEAAYKRLSRFVHTLQLVVGDALRSEDNTKVCVTITGKPLSELLCHPVIELH